MLVDRLKLPSNDIPHLGLCVNVCLYLFFSIIFDTFLVFFHDVHFGSVWVNWKYSCGNEVFMLTAGCLWLVAQLTLLPVRCVSPSCFKEPQTEPLLGERIVLWPLLFLLFLWCLEKMYFPFFSGKPVPWSTCCCVTGLLVTVSEMCVQYFVNRSAFETTQIH